MSKNLGETLYKLLGIFAIIQAIRMLENVLQYLAIDYGDQSFISVPLLGLAWLMPFLLLLGGGCFLVLRSRHLGSRDSKDDEGSLAAASGADIHSILLSSTGVLLIGIALSDLPAIASSMVIAYSELGEVTGSLQTPARAWGKLSGTLLQFGLGLLLVFKSTALVSLFRRRWNRTRPIAADAQCPHCGFWIVASDYQAGATGYRCDNCKGEIPHDLIHATQSSTGSPE